MTPPLVMCCVVTTFYTRFVMLSVSFGFFPCCTSDYNLSTSPSKGKDFGSTQSIFQQSAKRTHQSIFQRSAKNAFLTQTPEVWRDRRPSIFNPQGELCPPEERFSRRGACRPVANNRFLSDFAPENFRRNFSKIRKPKNSVGMKFPRSFCPFQRNRKIYLKRITHCTRVRATRAPS